MEKKGNTPHINVDYFEDLTGNIDKREKSDVAGVGQRIKELREKKGISVRYRYASYSY